MRDRRLKHTNAALQLDIKMYKTHFQKEKKIKQLLLLHKYERYQCENISTNSVSCALCDIGRANTLRHRRTSLMQSLRGVLCVQRPKRHNRPHHQPTHINPHRLPPLPFDKQLFTQHGVVAMHLLLFLHEIRRLLLRRRTIRR